MAKKIGSLNDGWQHKFVIPCEDDPKKKLTYFYVQITDSMIAYKDESDREIHHKVAFVFKRPWVGMLDGKPEDSSALVKQMRKLHMQGRFDQFLITEMVPGKDPVIHEHTDPEWLAQKILAIKVLEAAEEAASKK